ncbi:hypothetical protein ACFLYR_05110 [Chloroflexota bacterium]
MEEKSADKREPLKIDEVLLARMSLEQKRRAEQLYHELGLDSVVNKVLTDFPSSLSGMDRVIDKIFGVYDIKGRAEAVARLTALITHTALSEECHKKARQLEAQITSLEGERDKIRTNYDDIVHKVADIVGGNYNELKANYYELVDKLAIVEDLRSQMATLRRTLKKERAQLVERVPKILARDYEMAAEKGAEEAGKHADETLRNIINNTIDTEGIDVTLYTRTIVLSGSVYHLEEGRLLDLLNDGSDQRGWSAGPFLELINANARNADGHKQILPTAYIGKASVYMAVLADDNAARGVGAKAGHKPFPFVLKSPVPIELHMVNYVLIGNMHCASGQKPQDVLDEKPAFLPLTDVSIRTLRSDIELTAPFVAVNKEHVLPLEQKEISPADSRLLKAYRKLLELKLGYLN